MLRLEILLQAVDRLTAPVRAVQAALARTALVAARLNNATGAGALAASLAAVGRNAAQAAGQVAALGGRVAALAGAGTAAAGFAFNQSFVRPSAEMERYRITLETVEGSAAAAERALAWVDRFAARTPFELAEVTRAFVDIRNLGLDPTRATSRPASPPGRSACTPPPPASACCCRPMGWW